MSQDPRGKFTHFVMISITGAILYSIHKCFHRMKNKVNENMQENRNTNDIETQTEITQVNDPNFNPSADNFPENFFNNSGYPSVTGQIVTECLEEEDLIEG